MSAPLPSLLAILGVAFFAALLAVVAASEQVFLALTETQALRLKDDRGLRRDQVVRFVRDPQRVVVTSILSSGVFAAGAILCVLLVVAGNRGVGLRDLFGPGLLGGLLLSVMSRAIPRAFAAAHPERIALVVAPVFGAVDLVFLPLNGLVRRLLQRISPDASEEMVAAEEVKAVTEEHDEPVPRLEEEKRELLQSIFEFGGTTAKEIMVPRIDMIMAEADEAQGDVLKLVAEHGHSRIPIYEGTVDKIIGAVHVKQLVQAGAHTTADRPIRELVRPVVFVPESKKIDELLRDFQEKKSHLAIIVDEYGGTAGMATMEDVLEEIVGEIEDEDDTEEKLIEALDDGSWRVSGKVDLDDLNEELDLSLPTENSDTLGGLIFEIAGKVPSPGEVVDYQGLRFLIDRVHRQRVVRVRIDRLEEARVREGKGGGAFM